MNFDKVLDDLGEFGRWQKINIALLWFPIMMAGSLVLLGSFTLLEPDEYRCKIKGCDKNNFQFDDFEERWAREELFPCYNNSNNDNDQCSGEDEFCLFLKPVVSNGKCLSNLTNERVYCNSTSEFAFRKFGMEKTVTSEFNMFCDEILKLCRPMADCLYMVGLLAGGMVFGMMPDKIGRRHALLAAILTAFVGNLAGVFMPGCWSYGVSRLVSGAGHYGSKIASFILIIEIMGKKKRLPCAPWVTLSGFFANLCGVPFALGEVLVVLLAMVFTDWRNLQVAGTVFCLLVGTVWFFISESPRWLIATGNIKEARKVIETAAKINKVEVINELNDDVNIIPEDIKYENNSRPEGTSSLVLLPSPSDENYGIKDLFNSTCCHITIALFVVWLAFGLLYYGITLASHKIKVTSNLHLSFIVICLIEIPAAVIFPIIMDVFGRKPLVALCLLIPGIFCIISAFHRTSWVFTVLIIITKMAVTGGKTVSQIFTAELYPTPVRTTALGACSTLGRIGSIAAPWVAVYLPDHDSLPEWVPILIFGIVAIIGSMASLLLPETLGHPLPDNFNDLENMKKNDKPIWKWINPKTWTTPRK